METLVDLRLEASPAPEPLVDQDLPFEVRPFLVWRDAPASGPASEPRIPPQDAEAADLEVMVAAHDDLTFPFVIRKFSTSNSPVSRTVTIAPPWFHLFRTA